MPTRARQLTPTMSPQRSVLLVVAKGYRLRLELPTLGDHRQVAHALPELLDRYVGEDRRLLGDELLVAERPHEKPEAVVDAVVALELLELGADPLPELRMEALEPERPRRGLPD